MKERGITLIALVITIIVLLILTAVSVATLTGENGIISKAREAKERTETATVEEQFKLAQLSLKLQAETQNENITIDQWIEELKKQGLKIEKGDNNTIVVDGKYKYEISMDETKGNIDYKLLEIAGTPTVPDEPVEPKTIYFSNGVSASASTNSDSSKSTWYTETFIEEPSTIEFEFSGGSSTGSTDRHGGCCFYRRKRRKRIFDQWGEKNCHL